MAEGHTDSVTKQAFQKLEHQLQCAICLEPYKDPKLLQCFHFFCKECLERLVVQDRQSLELSARCPTCRRFTLLSANGVSGLQSAFHINHLFEIQEALEKVKQPQEASTPTSEEGGLVSPKKVVAYCPYHKDRQLELYCKSCGEVICFQCTLRLHSSHKYDLISEVFERYKGEITASLEPVETQLGIINKALQQLDTQREQITDQRAAIEAEIHKTIQRLHQELDVRRTKLIGQLDHMTQHKLKNLEAQEDEIKTHQTQLNSCLEFVRESLNTGSQEEVVNMKKPVVKQIREMTANFNPDALKPSEVADINFITSPDTTEALKQFGTVCHLQVSPERCYVADAVLQTAAIVGKTSTATLYTVDASNEPCTIPVDSISCKLVLNVPAGNPQCAVKYLEKNQHEISYQPTTRGRHQLHIKVDGGQIRGSPFTVMAKLPLSSSGSPSVIIPRLNGTGGIEINKRGEVIVTEYNGHCVSIFSASGEKLRSFGSGRHRQLRHPRGVAVDDDDSILVVDGDNYCIQKFTADGEFITAVGRKSIKYFYPVSVAIHPHNKMVYVTDCSYHRVQILNPDLTFSNSFGSHGSSNGQFKYPWNVAFDNTGNVYVADSGNHCVQVFTADGQFLRKFGKYGKGDGKLNFPSSVAIDSDNVVYVAEYYNNRVSVFTCEDQFRTSFGTKGNGAGQFDSPRGIAVDKWGVVYVSDRSRVQVF